MAKKLYVGNLPYSTDMNELKQLFSTANGEELASIGEVTVIMDRESGRSKGFGFVEYADDADAEKAIAAYNGYSHNDRELTVNEARPREERPQGGFRGGNRGGYRDGGNRGGYNRDSAF